MHKGAREADTLEMSLPVESQLFAAMTKKLIIIPGILLPAVLDELKGAKSPLTGKPVQLVAAGGMIDGRSLAAALAYGAEAVS